MRRSPQRRRAIHSGDPTARERLLAKLNRIAANLEEDGQEPAPPNGEAGFLR